MSELRIDGQVLFAHRQSHHAAAGAGCAGLGERHVGRRAHDLDDRLPRARQVRPEGMHLDLEAKLAE